MHQRESKTVKSGNNKFLMNILMSAKSYQQFLKFNKLCLKINLKKNYYNLNSKKKKIFI